jgi:hypothetical protein
MRGASVMGSQDQHKVSEDLAWHNHHVAIIEGWERLARDAITRLRGDASVEAEKAMT